MGNQKQKANFGLLLFGASKIDSIRSAFVDLYELSEDKRKQALEQLQNTEPAVFEIVQGLFHSLRLDPNAARIDSSAPILHATPESKFMAASNTQEGLGLPAVLERKTDLSQDLPRVRLKRSQCLPDFSNRAKNGRYIVLEEIARGGMGAVLRAIDTDLGREVAIKVMLPEHFNSPSVLKRFVEEAQIGGQLQHPGIAPIYDAGLWENDCPFFSMKFVNGRTLSELLKTENPTNERSQLLSTFLQVCQAVGYAHQQGVIHRDLKPANIMVGEFSEVLVMDWGLAKVLDSEADPYEPSREDHGKPIASSDTVDAKVEATMALDSSADGARGETGTKLGSLLGTPGYMSPEQAKGRIAELTPRSDVFSLGAILFKLLTGQSLYQAESQLTVINLSRNCRTETSLTLLDNTTHDPELKQLVRDCLAKEPDQRPQDAAEIGQRLEDYQNSVEARFRESEVELERSKTRLAEERKRRVFQFTAAVSSLVAIASLVIGVWWAERKQAALDASRASQQDQAAQQVQEELALAEAYGGLNTDAFPDQPALENAVAALSRAKSVDGQLLVAPNLVQQVDEVAELVEARVREAQLIRDLESAYEREMEFRFQQRQAYENAKRASAYDWSANRSTEEMGEAPPEESLPVEPFDDPVEMFSDAFASWGLHPSDEPSEMLEQLQSLHEQHQDFVIACLDRWQVLLNEDVPFDRWQQCDWSNLQPVELKSRGGDELRTLEDRSILASGPNAWAGYELIFDTKETQISSFRLEALLHESLPNHGPGRHPGSDGSLSVDALRVEIAPVGNLENRQQLEFISAVADYSWTKNPIKPDTWRLAYGGGRPHAAVFVLDTPIVSQSGFRIWITTADRRRGFSSSKKTLGRFRWSCTDEPLPTQRTAKAEQLWQLANAFDRNPWRRRVRAGVRGADIEQVIQLGENVDPKVESVDSLVQLADWITKIDKQTRTRHLATSFAWKNLGASKITAKNGTQHEPLPDGSFLASGPNPKDEVIEIEVPLDSNIGALRFQAIPHEVSTEADGRWYTWSRHEKKNFGDVGLNDVSCRLIGSDGKVIPIDIRLIAHNQLGEWDLDERITDGDSSTYAHLWQNAEEVSIYFGLQDVIEAGTDSNSRLVISLSTGMGRGYNFRRFRFQIATEKPNGEQLSAVAASLLRTAVEIEPDNYWARISLLTTLLTFNQPDTDECRTHAAAAVALQPKRATSLAMALETALVDIERADLKKTISASSMVDKFSEYFPDSHYAKLSRERRDQRLLELAEKAPEQFIEFEDEAFEVLKNDANSLNSVGVRLERKMPDFAGRCYTRSLELDPRKWTYAKLGIIELEQRRPLDKAEDYLRKSLDLDSNYSPALAALAMVRIYQNKASEAIGFAQQSVSADPNWAHSHYVLGRALSEHGQQRDAIQALLASLRLEPQASLHRDIGRIYRWLHELKLARQHYSSALETHQNNLTLAYRAAEVAARMGQREAAFEQLGRAIELNPNNGVLRSVRGQIKLWFGDMDEAEQDILAGYEMSPESEVASTNYFSWLVTSGASDKLLAQESLGLSLPKLPNPLYAELVFSQNTPAKILSQIVDWLDKNLERKPRYLRSRAEAKIAVAKYRLGQYDEAIVELEKSIERRGEVADKERFVLPMALQAVGRNEEAKEAFNRAEQWRKDTIPFDPSFSLIRDEAANALEIQVDPIVPPR